MNGPRASLAGSAPQHDESVQRSAVAADQELTATLVLRRKPGTADDFDQLLSGHFQPVSRDEALEQISADPQDVAAVESFAREYGLRVIEADAAKRVVKVSGSVPAFDCAFGVQLGMYGNFISYEGPISLPKALTGVVFAVLGLDNRPVARTKATGSAQ